MLEGPPWARREETRGRTLPGILCCGWDGRPGPSLRGRQVGREKVPASLLLGAYWVLGTPLVMGSRVPPSWSFDRSGKLDTEINTKLQRTEAATVRTVRAGRGRVLCGEGVASGPEPLTCCTRACPSVSGTAHDRPALTTGISALFTAGPRRGRGKGLWSPATGLANP